VTGDSSIVLGNLKCGALALRFKYLPYQKMFKIKVGDRNLYRVPIFVLRAFFEGVGKARFEVCISWGLYWSDVNLNFEMPDIFKSSFPITKYYVNLSIVLDMNHGWTDMMSPTCVYFVPSVQRM
jgi:hypothetical protein